jgi:hypothetical protein
LNAKIENFKENGKKTEEKNSKPLRYHSKANDLPKQERLGDRGFLKRFFCTLPL